MPRFDPNDYVDVQSRIARFWKEYPEGRIETQLVSNPDTFDQVVFRAAVYKERDDKAPSATGWAAEKAGGGGANQTSWHENGETSAIGRALANLGYATSQKDRPSQQEMQKVARHDSPRPTPPAGEDIEDVPFDGAAVPAQPAGDHPSEKQIKYMGVLMDKAAISVEDARAVMKERYGKTSRQVLTRAEASDFIEWLTAQQPMETLSLISN